MQQFVISTAKLARQPNSHFRDTLSVALSLMIPQVKRQNPALDGSVICLSKILIGSLQINLCLFSLGDIARGGLDFGHMIFLIVNDFGGSLQPDIVTIFMSSAIRDCRSRVCPGRRS